MPEDTKKKEYEFRQAKIEYDYHLKQVRYHLANLARCRVQVNTSEDAWHTALEKSGCPDPDEERARILRMLQMEGTRHGKIYGEEDIPRVQESMEQRKAREFHEIMVQKYRAKKAQGK